MRIRVTFSCILIGLMLPLSLRAPLSTAQGKSRHMPAPRSTPSMRVDWNRRDLAVYVVSTLNLPLCSRGRKLSTVLRGSLHASYFDVYESRMRPNVYFIRVNTAQRRLLSVYGYELGRTLPLGVWHAICVSAAPDWLRALYRPDAVQWIARLSSTTPG